MRSRRKEADQSLNEESLLKHNEDLLQSTRSLQTELGTAQSLLRETQAEYGACQRALRAEQDAHEDCKLQLRREAAAAALAQQELRELRDKVAEQGQQIQALRTELVRLRGQTETGAGDCGQSSGRPDYEAKLRLAWAEIQRLGEDLDSSRRMNEELSHSNSLLRDALRSSAATPPLRPQDGSALLSLYQDKANQLEQEKGLLLTNLAESHDMESRLRERCGELMAGSGEAELLRGRVQELLREKQRSDDAVEDLELRLRAALERAEAATAAASSDQAQAWWQCVWLEARRQESGAGRERGTDDRGAAQHKIDADALNELKEAAKAQAIEITVLRQEALRSQIGHRHELDGLREQLEFSQREAVRQASAARAHKGNRELQIAEMSKTVRVLSTKSDTHSLLAGARQELEAARLEAQQLTAELATCSSRGEDDRRRVLLLRKQLQDEEGLRQCGGVLRSVTDVPGMRPAALIEACGGKILQLQAEQAKLRTELSTARELIGSLQRVNASLKRRQTEPLNESDKQPPDTSARSLNKSYSELLKRSPSSVSASPVDSPLPGELEGREAGDEAQEADDSVQRRGDWLSIFVDGRSTPAQVLASLDAADLAERLSAAAALEEDLRGRLEERDAAVLRAEAALEEQQERLEASVHIELSAATQRLTLLQSGLEEAEAEVRHLRDRNSSLERALAHSTAKIFESSGGSDKSTAQGADAETASGDASTRRSTDTLEGVNASELMKELAATKHTLRERTTQLKVLMGSLDALQLAGVSGERAPEPGDRWALQALVRRVVELTTQLAAQSAAAAMEERRAEQLESSLRRKAKEVNKLKSHFKLTEERSSKTDLQAGVLKSRLQELEQQRVEAAQVLRRENDELVAALREAELRLKENAITIEQMHRLAEAEEQDEFKAWLDRVILSDTTSATEAPMPAGDPTDTEAVRALVQELLSQWVRFVGRRPSQTAAGPQQLSKAERRFLQRVSDLVLAAHQRCAEAERRWREAEHGLFRAALGQRCSQQRLVVAMQHLHRYRKRAQAAEKLAAVDKSNTLSAHTKLLSILRRSLAEERHRLLTTAVALTNEQRERKILEIKSTLSSADFRRMQARLAQSESGGSAMLLARAEAAAALGERAKGMEDTFQRWAEQELPRLLSGLPVTEDSWQLAAAESGAGPQSSKEASVLDDYRSLFGRPQTDPLGHPAGGQRAGMDGRYALAQALYASKAAQTMQEAQLLQLKEINSILKEKCMELEGVVARWRAELEGAAQTTDEVDRRTQQVYNAADAESQALSQLRDLSAKVSLLEEERAALTSRLGYAEDSAAAMRQLVDAASQQEHLLQTRAVQQMARAKQDLEAAHALELRQLRDAYESETLALSEDLDQVAAAIAEGGGYLRRPRPLLSAEPQIAGRAAQDKAAIANTASAPAVDPVLDESSASSQSEAAVPETESRGGREDQHGDKHRPGAIRVSRAKYSNQENFSNKGKKGSHGSESALGDSTASERLSSVCESEEDSSAAGRSSMAAQLGLERERVRKAQLEIRELELLLETQRQAFSARLDDIDQPSGASDEADSDIERRRRSGAPRNTMSLASASGLPLPPRAGKRSHRYSTQEAMPGELSRRPLREELSLAELGFESPPAIPRAPVDLETEATRKSGPRSASGDLARLAAAAAQLEELADMLRSLLSYRAVSSSPPALGLINAAIELAIRTRDVCTASRDALFREAPIDRSRHSAADLDGATPPENSQIAMLASLASRVQKMENEASEDTVSEGHLVLIKELREEVLEIQQVRELELESNRRRWEEEKRLLLTDAREAQQRAQQEHLQSQEAALQLVRQQHEQQLRLYEDALAMQTKAAREQVQRLEGLLKDAQRQMAQLLQQRGRRDGHSSTSPARRRAATPPPPPQRDDDLRQELVRLNGLLAASKDEAAAAQLVREQTARLLRAKDAILHSLETQIAELQQSQSRAVAVSDQSPTKDGQESFLDVQSRLRTMEFQYRSKACELEAVLRSLGDEDAAGGGATDDLFRTELLLGRTQAADAEVLAAHAELAAERRTVFSLKAQLQAALKQQDEYLLAEELQQQKQLSVIEEPNYVISSAVGTKLSIVDAFLSETAKEVELPEGAAHRDKVKILIRKANDIRRQGRSAVTRLSEWSASLQAEFATKEEKYSSMIQQLRDENGRKAKLISGLREGKSADYSALEQWRAECRELDDANKRLQRALAAKDTLAKELRSRLEQLDGRQDKEAADENSVSVAELRNRVRSLEAEKVRTKARLTTMKEKMAELESAAGTAEGEAARLARMNERAEALRTAVTRKDALIRSLKEQIERLKAEMADNRGSWAGQLEEAEARHRLLQRRLDDQVAEIVHRPVVPQQRQGDPLREVIAALGAEDYLGGLLQGRSRPAEQHFQAMFPDSRPVSRSTGGGRPPSR